MGKKGRNRRRQRRAERQDMRFERWDNKLERRGGRGAYKIEKKMDRLEIRNEIRGDKSQKLDHKRYDKRLEDEAVPMTHEEFERNEMRERGKPILEHRENLQKKLLQLRAQSAAANSPQEKAHFDQEIASVEKELGLATRDWRIFEADYSLKHKEWKRTKNWRGWNRRLGARDFVLQAKVDDDINYRLHSGLPYQRRTVALSTFSVDQVALMNMRAAGPAPTLRRLGGRRVEVDLNDMDSVARALMDSNRSPDDLQQGDPIAMRALGLDPAKANTGVITNICENAWPSYECLRDMDRAKKEMLDSGDPFDKAQNIMNRFGPLGGAALIGAGVLAVAFRKSLPKPLQTFALWSGIAGGVLGGGLLLDRGAQGVFPKYDGVFNWLRMTGNHPDLWGNSENLQEAGRLFANEINSKAELEAALITKDISVQSFYNVSKMAIEQDDPKWIEKEFLGKLNDNSQQFNRNEKTELKGHHTWDYFKEVMVLGAKEAGFTSADFPGNEERLLRKGLEYIKLYGPNKTLAEVHCALKSGVTPKEKAALASVSSETLVQEGYAQNMLIESGMDVFYAKSGLIYVNGAPWEMTPTSEPDPEGVRLKCALHLDNEYKHPEEYTLYSPNVDGSVDSGRTAENVKLIEKLSKQYMMQEIEMKWGWKKAGLTFDESEHLWRKTNGEVHNGEAFSLYVVPVSNGRKLALQPRGKRVGFNASFEYAHEAIAAYQKFIDESQLAAEKAEKAAAAKAAEKGFLEKTSDAVSDGVKKAGAWGREQYDEWTDGWPLPTELDEKKLSELSKSDIAKLNEHIENSVRSSYDSAEKVQIDAWGIGGISHGNYKKFLDLCKAEDIDKMKAKVRVGGTKVEDLRSALDKDVRGIIEDAESVGHYSGERAVVQAMEELRAERLGGPSKNTEADKLIQEMQSEENERMREEFAKFVDEVVEKNDLDYYGQLDTIFTDMANQRFEKFQKMGTASDRDKQFSTFKAYLEGEAGRLGLFIEAKKFCDKKTGRGTIPAQLAGWFGDNTLGLTAKVMNAMFNHIGEEQYKEMTGLMNTEFWAHWGAGKTDTSTMDTYLNTLGPKVKTLIEKYKTFPES